MQLDTGIFTSESPIYGRTSFVASVFISLDLSPQCLFISNTPIETLPHQHTQLNLSHIQPTAVLGRVVKFQSPQYPSSFCWLKCFVKRCHLMCVQVVRDYSDYLGLWVSLIYQPFHLMRKVFHRAMPCDFNMPPTCLRLTKNEQIACPIAFVFVIMTLSLSGFDRLRHFSLFNQLLVSFVKTDFRAIGVIRLFIQIKYVLHRCHKLSTHLRDAPVLFLPGLERVFLSTLRTVSCEKELANPSSTTLSANKRSVQRSRPPGGVLQAIAIKCVSCLVFNLCLCPGRGRSSRAPRLSSTNRLRVRSTVGTLVLSTAAICLSVRPSSALIRMR